MARLGKEMRQAQAAIEDHRPLQRPDPFGKRPGRPGGRARVGGVAEALDVRDEVLARERLSHLVEDMPDVELAGIAASGEEALLLAGRLKPEVVLLDIRMPGMDGLEAAHHLARMPEPPAVIFTTAYEQHALAAFDAQAAGYLLKPVRPERLREGPT